MTSADGTVIACDRISDGPALIVCNGALSTRAAFTAPAGLARQFTVVTYDRRGRGDSGDAHDAEAPFTSDETPQPDVDPDQRIRELTGAGRNRQAVEFWMREVARLPDQALARLDGALSAARSPIRPILADFFTIRNSSQ